MFQLAHPSPSYNHQLALKHHLEDRPTSSSTGGVDNNNNNNIKRHDIGRVTPDEHTSSTNVDEGNYQQDNEHRDTLQQKQQHDGTALLKLGDMEFTDIDNETLDTLQKHPQYLDYIETLSNHVQHKHTLKDEVLNRLLEMKERRAKQLQSISPSNKPPNWETYGFYKTRHYFQCKEHAHKVKKPLPSIDYWNELKDAYRKYVDVTIEFDDLVSPVDGYNLDGEGNPQPYHADHGTRGRGLFASRDIKRGELVHDGTKSDYLFKSKEQWLRLAYNLPREMACDLIDWSWTAQSEKGDPNHSNYSQQLTYRY